MDELRWILLAVAVIFVLGVYFFSRSRKKDEYRSPLDAANDVPSFSADENTAEDDDWKDGVGPVRVVAENSASGVEEAIAAVQIKLDQQLEAEEAHENTPADTIEIAEPLNTPPEAAVEATIGNTATDTQASMSTTVASAENNQSQPVADPDTRASDTAATEAENDKPAEDDVIAVYVLASSAEPVLKGEKILSASYALHLEHGEKNIFHRFGEAGENSSGERELQFSMANIEAPGWFELENMNQLETRGLSFFLQVNLLHNPSAVLDEMLICAHSMSTMLGAKLCNAQRQPLDEAYTTHLRNKVKRLLKARKPSA